MLGFLFRPRRREIGPQPTPPADSRAVAALPEPVALPALDPVPMLPGPVPDAAVAAAPPGSVAGRFVPELGRLPPEQHADALLDWFMFDGNADAGAYCGLTDSDGALVEQPPPGTGYIVGPEEVHEAYVEMCAEYLWEPLPWNRVGKFFADLTGGKTYRNVPNPRDNFRMTAKKRVYMIPAPAVPWPEMRAAA